MFDKIYSWFLIFSMAVLAITIFGYFIRTVLGPHFSDRIVAVNSISTVVMLIISILAVIQGENYIVDIAIIYSVLGFVTVIILCKAYLRSHHKDRANDLKNIKSEVEKK